MSCIFCNLSNDKNAIIYETQHTFAILDRFPTSRGHVLVIPKAHSEYLHMCKDEDIGDTLLVIKHIVKTLGYTKYNILQNNVHMQEVLHVHFHIIPYVDQIQCLKVNWSKYKPTDDEYRSEVNFFKKKLIN